jgi:uncharacterized DUF497 family protein
MKKYSFDWDLAKARSNIKKHKMSFDEASTVFRDPSAKTWFDEIHSVQEDRDLIIGYSIRGRVLIVSFPIRESETIRIISARLATGKECREYEEEKRGFGGRDG